jgi:DNA-binding NtrC family response regulator
VVLEDPAVSRRHALVTLTARGVLVRDLHSKNGTVVAGADAIEAFLPLSSGAKIGGTTVRLRLAGPPTDLPLWPGGRFGDVLGGSVRMRALFAEVQRVVADASPVLLRGETGTGKELLARAMHGAGPRASLPFVVLDLGEQRDIGAALREAANGVLFVDELGDLGAEAQARLVRALDTREQDARIVCATTQEVRPELFFRLSGAVFRVPPLRERKEDIELLTDHFLGLETPPKRTVDLPPGAVEMLRGHDWPGNVRELKNTLARVVRHPHLAHTGLALSSPVLADPSAASALFALPLREARQEVVDRFEAQYLAAKLEEHQGNVSKAAAAMGLSRQMVHRLLARHGIGSRDAG